MNKKDRQLRQENDIRNRTEKSGAQANDYIGKRCLITAISVPDATQYLI